MADLTHQSKEVSNLNTPASELNTIFFHLPLTDANKVQFLIEELSAGRYQVQSQTLASKLIEHVHPANQQLEMA